MLEFITNQNISLSYSKNLCERTGDRLTAPIHEVFSSRALTITYLAIGICAIIVRNEVQDENQGKPLTEKSLLIWAFSTFNRFTLIGIFFRTIGRLANQDFRSLYFSR